jgi:hypothetical protein
LEVSPDGTILTVDGWLRLAIKMVPGQSSPAEISSIILMFRGAWDQFLATAFTDLFKRGTSLRSNQAFLDSLVAIVTRDMGEMDVDRLIKIIAEDKIRTAKLMEKSKEREDQMTTRRTRKVAGRKLKAELDKYTKLAEEEHAWEARPRKVIREDPQEALLTRLDSYLKQTYQSTEKACA